MPLHSRKMDRTLWYSLGHSRWKRVNTATTSTSQGLWLFPAWLLEGDARVSNLTQTHSISILSFLDIIGMFCWCSGRGGCALSWSQAAPPNHITWESRMCKSIFSQWSWISKLGNRRNKHTAKPNSQHHPLNLQLPPNLHSELSPISTTSSVHHAYSECLQWWWMLNLLNLQILHLSPSPIVTHSHPSSDFPIHFFLLVLQIGNEGMTHSITMNNNPSNPPFPSIPYV